MGNDYALRLSRRAGGVDDVGRSLRWNGQVKVYSRLLGQRTGQFLDRKGAYRGREAGRHRALGQQQRRFGVFEKDRDPRLRVRRIDRNIHAAGLEHAENGDNHLRRTVQAEGDAQRLGRRMLPLEEMRKLVGARVQFRIRDRDGAEAKSSCRRRRSCLRLKDTMDRSSGGILRFCLVPPHHDLLQILVAQPAEAGCRYIWTPGCVFEQRLQRGDPAIDRARVEQARVVVNFEPDGLALVDEVEENVGIDRRLRIRFQPCLETGKLDPCAYLLQVELRLDQFQPCRVARYFQLPHQCAEGVFLVIECIVDLALDLAGEPGKARGVCNLHPDRQKVHRVADKTLAAKVSLAGHRDAHHDVLLARQFTEQQGIAAEQGAEKGVAALC